MSQTCDILIVGGGAAGLTAGLYASRGNRNVVLLERAAPGGVAATTDSVENYPGFLGAPTGPELMEKFLKHAKQYGTRIDTGEATGLTPGEPMHTVHTSAGDYTAAAIILACGANHRKLKVPGEKEFSNRGVSYCATCDGPLFRDKEVLVVGGGDAAIEGALFVANFASSVKVIHRRDELRATKILQERAFREPKISFLWDSVVTQISGDKLFNGVTMRNVKTDEETSLAAQGLFVLIGSVPNSAWLKGVVEMDERGYVRIDTFCETNVKGIYAAGEVADAVFRQIVVAAGQGCMAAISAERRLQQLTG